MRRIEVQAVLISKNKQPPTAKVVPSALNVHGVKPCRVGLGRARSLFGQALPGEARSTMGNEIGSWIIKALTVGTPKQNCNMFERIDPFRQNPGASSAKQICGAATVKIRTRFLFCQDLNGSGNCGRNKLQNAPADRRPIGR
jgi:hypothetical protein